MNRVLTLGIALLALAAVVVQFALMLTNSTNTVAESTIRFFSYFTILTNTLVSVYFFYRAYRLHGHRNSIPYHFGTLTAITVYITIVGLVYQLLLRHTWSPTGLQRIVDEMLHSVNPVLVIGYWLLNKKENTLAYHRLVRWLIYPLLYLICVLIRGYFSNFYPYPFLDVTSLGFQQVIVNSFGITLLFIIISVFFIGIAKLTGKKRSLP